MKTNSTLLGLALLLVMLSHSTLPAISAKPEMSSFATQQKRSITGVVVDVNNVPVIGATVIIKGTTDGILTDVNGRFELKVAKGTTLVFSMLGMESVELTINDDQKEYSVTMIEDTKSIEEVMVVGYGSQRKATVSGAVSAVKGDQIKKSNAMNISSAFAGRIPGVVALNRSGEPGKDGSQILVRGKGTLNNTSPLIVIDGVANRSGLERLNPSDIESISVLKDASAAIYGAQAANGVILVTTKGGYNSKPKVEYNGSYSLSQFTRTPQLLNAYQYMVWDDERAVHLGQQPQFENIKGGYLDGTINRDKYGDTDWFKAIFSEFSPETRQSVSLRGGTDKTSYYLSGDYTFQKPAFKNTVYNYQTSQFRLNLDQKLSDNLKVGVKASIRNEYRNQPPGSFSTGTIFYEATHTYPYLYDYYPNGLTGPGINAYGNNLAVLAQGREVGYGKIEDMFIDTKFDLDWQLPWITKGLSIQAFVATDTRFSNTREFSDMWDTYIYNDATGDYTKRTTNLAGNNITLKQQSGKYIKNTLNARINYNRTFGNHTVGGFVAYEHNKNTGDIFEAWRGYYLSNKIDFLNQGGDKNKTNGGWGEISARQNIFGRLNYDYKSKYMVEFTLRYDGSMNFAASQRWGLFPGVSAAWRITEEEFMKDSRGWLNELKLRGSWGLLGNDRVAQFQYLSTFNQEVGAVLGETPTINQAFYPGRIGNPNITWEKVDSKNIAIDASLFNNRLSFSGEYFFQRRTDILTPKIASIPDYTGLVLPDQNIGEVTNGGLELSLNFADQVGDFRYNIGGNFTYVKNKIIFFDEAPNIPDHQRRTGYSIDSWLMYKTDGIYTSQSDIDATPHLAGARPGDIKYVDIDGDNKITSNDRYRDYTSNVPQIVYGINLGFGWKGLDFNMLWTGQARAKQMIIPYSFNPPIHLYEGRFISEKETPDAKFPRAFNHQENMNNVYSDFWLEDASFIRLKNVELSYTLPKTWMDKLKIENVRIFVVGSNLFTIDKIGYLDPESATVNVGQYYPQTRTYSFGLNTTF